MIEIRDLKEKVHNSDKFRGSSLDSVLQEYGDTVTEDQYIALVPAILKLGRAK